MTETIYESLFIKGIPEEVVIFLISSLPISELRGAIPLGILVMHQSITKTFFLAVLGNMLPVAPLLLFLEPVSNKLRKFKLWANFFDWLFARTRKRAKLIEKLEALGLILFVCLPLPVTGAWTGCVAATLFKMRFKLAFLSIGIGVIIAGLIVTMLTLLSKSFI